MMFLQRNLYIFLLIVISIGVYNIWFLPGLFVSDDWWFFFNDALIQQKSNGTWFNDNHGLGTVNLVLSRFPLDILTGLLASYGIGWSFIEKILFLWPAALIPPLASYILIGYIVRHKLAAFVGSIIFSFSTYYIAINSVGHILLSVAGGFAILTIYFFLRAMHEESWRFSTITALVLTITGYYDFRLFYINVLIFCLYILWLAYQRVALRKKLVLFLYIITASILCHIFWILSLFSISGVTHNNALSRSLFGDSYWTLQNAITTYHPFWNIRSGSEWFVVQNIPFHAYIIPLIAFIGLFFSRNNQQIVFFGILSLVGILLSKQTDRPFVELYKWFYENIPGFNAYREATKFYFITLVGYGVLIAAFFKKYITCHHMASWLTGVRQYIIAGILILLVLINTYPIVIHNAENLYAKRSLPTDYIIANSILCKDIEWCSIVSVPGSVRWMSSTKQKRIMSAAFLHENEWRISASMEHIPLHKKIVNVLTNQYSEKLLSISGVRYVIVPLKEDDDNDIYQYYGGKYNEYIREWYIQQLDSVGYLKKIDIGTKELVVYENKSVRPHIYTTIQKETFRKNIPYKEVELVSSTSTKYVVRLENISTPVWLNFSEKYHPGWNVRIGPFSWGGVFYKDGYFLSQEFHKESDAMLNTFFLDPEYIKATVPRENYVINPDGSISMEVTIYFRAQSYFYLGLMISGIAVAGMVGYLVFDSARRYRRRQSNVL